ncbi:ABC transporter permease [Paenibacillus kyungheensis]|uniref:Nickel import system permease protein NikB n=1 Tax=Paenibacillus kyungheensis TaxID=1452732 RepID=A0AAX3M8U4_9BACL|nr:nickel ABC transporter permease [Paenibacillus kyungheensis]WCT57763.1 ABC transporter permease [Paenibacillus kyungheensis]
MRMLIQKITGLLLFLFILSFISFCLLKLVPGDPVRSMLRVDDVAVTNEQIQQMRAQLGLDQSVFVQYGYWLQNLFSLDLGHSYMTARPVFSEFIEKIPYTLMLTGTSLLVMMIISLPLGILSALYRGRWTDHISRIFALIGSSIPSFWLGLLLIDLFAVKLRILPSMGEGSWQHLILPSITLGIAMSAVYVRLVRASILESSHQEFIRSARARGIGKKRIFTFHLMRHSLIPLLTVFSESIGSLLGGTVMIEVLFAYPGLGKWIVDAITARDYPIIQGYMLFMSIFIVLLNMAVEWSYRYINPAIAIGQRKKGATS